VTSILDRANDLQAPEAAGGCWTREYSWRHCEGYMVDAPDGRLGFVSEVVEAGDSLELVVGRASGELRVPRDAIQYFDPARERIMIALPAP